MAESFRDLIAWQKAMALVTEVYRATAAFPDRETYGLTNQLRRAAVSVPSNIAEGKGRYSRREFAQFLANARGSLCEVETQLEIGRNLGYLAADSFVEIEGQAREVGRVLNGLIKTIRIPRAGSPGS
jgi:four helix bundle protein